MLSIIPVTLPEDYRKRYTRYDRRLKTIRVSWIYTYKYCPYQLYLEEVKGIKMPETPRMLSGTIAHRNLEVEHSIRAEREMSIEDALLLSQLEKEAYVFREVPIVSKFRRYQLSGRIDEIAVYPDRIEIIDDKPGNVLYDGSVYQVYGYILAFKNMFGVSRKIYAVVRSHTADSVIYREEFGGDAETKIRDTLSEIFHLLREEYMPRIEINPAKCRSCRFREVCPYYSSWKEGKS